MFTVPSTFDSSPRSAESREDFPAPTGPTTASRQPCGTLRFILQGRCILGRPSLSLCRIGEPQTQAGFPTGASSRRLLRGRSGAVLPSNPCLATQAAIISHACAWEHICAHPHTCTHTQHHNVCAHTQVYACLNKRVFTRARMCVHIPPQCAQVHITRLCVHMTHAHIQAHISDCTCKQTCSQTCTHRHAHVYTHRIYCGRRI